MVDLVQHIDSVLKKYNPDRIIVACSAGLDSTVLLHACLKLNYPVEIAHVNYQLRGEESESDALFLKQLSDELSIPFHVKTIDLNAQLKEGGNLQDLARRVRYVFFDMIRGNSPNTFVLLAHHLEDQTETFFMNLARNSGVMGLAAMPERRGSYLRPLLQVSKEDLKAFAEENKISWREDSSNASLKYTRNEWRNSVLPELRKALPELDQSVSILTSAFQDKQLKLHEKVRSILKQIRDTSTLEVKTFKALDDFEQVELCRQLGQPIGILETWNKLDHKGTGIELKDSLHLPFLGDRMIFDGDVYSFVIDPEHIRRLYKTTSVKSLPTTFDKRSIYLDSGRIQGEIRFRPVETGDRIHPIGMTGSRLVSDVISDAKLRSRDKHQLQILVDDEHVLWVPNLCVSRKAIATSDSSEILKVELY